MDCYVIQVAPGKEAETEELIRCMIDPDLYTDLFHPKRFLRKKFRGKWQDVHEKLLPGYVFLETEEIRKVYLAMKRVPKLTKFLGREEDSFYPLTKEERSWLSAITGNSPGHEVNLSDVIIEENRNVRIVSGPLIYMEGKIKKVNLHRRIAEVEVEFMGRPMVLNLGIDILEQA